MTRICHFFDETAGWEQRVGAWQLLDRLDRDQYEQNVAVLAGGEQSTFANLSTAPTIIPQLAPLDFLSAPFLGKHLDRTGTDIVHAWGIRAASVAAAATDLPIVVELTDPSRATQFARLIRSIARTIGFGVVCQSERLRRLLTENGVALELSTVIRPGVDFSQINKTKRGDLRERLGLRDDDFVITAPEQASRGSGQFDVAVGTCLYNHIAPNTRLLLPRRSPSQHQIADFCVSAAMSPDLYCSGEDYPVEDLVAVSDVLAIASRGEMPTASIAWAMAANTAIIAPAVYSVAELIGSGLNGILYRHEPDRSPSVTIAKLLRDREKQNKMKEVARGHAYEVFGIRRRIDQMTLVYRNVLDGNSAGDGIVDSAIAS